MTLQQAREEIDAIDLELRALLLRRMDAAAQVARAKLREGETTVFRPERERAILQALGEGIPEDRLDAYLASATTALI